MKTYKYNQTFALELGEELPYLEIAYHTYGKLNKDKSNVVWVCHALTANSDVFDWWSGLFGENDLYNPESNFIVCANILGSCYGTTSPLQTTKNKKYHKFPMVTIRDMVNAHEVLRKHLRIEKINTIIGGSMGGQQALEWNIQQPDLFENLILLATNARHSPWGIAFNESQRMAIENDSTWQLSTVSAGLKGLKAARSMALLSYRSYFAYNQTQQEIDDNKTDNFKASSYQRYQGEKLIKRFNAFSYYRLSQAMDSHNLGRNRESIEIALRKITANTLVIGINTDFLFPPNEQRFIAKHIENSRFVEIESFYGHDGFLVETDKLTEIIQVFFEQEIVKINRNKLMELRA
ncbi:MAG: homoserine O-acetyltransferase [Cognaticolwellia sp.]|jgi:homoserine O-acetyltransferase